MMGIEKDRQIKAEENWEAKAQREGWRCSSCRATPPYGDRDVFFRTHMCGYCAHVIDKDD